VGAVDLSVEGAPAGWTVRVDPASVTLSADASIPATLLIDVPSNSLAGTSPLTVRAVPRAPAKDAQLSATASIEVANELYLQVPPGTAGNNHPWPTDPIRLGAAVIFTNGDGVEHRIHSGNDLVGFPHQPGSLIPGNPESNYEVTITEAGTYSFYCHEHGEGVSSGTVTVLPAE